MGQLRGLPEGRLLAWYQHVIERQYFVLLARIIDQTPSRITVGTAGVQVTGKLDDHQAVMLFAYLGLQVAAVTGLGAGHELIFIGL
ncbi:hypothetical protein D9M73_279400 [compost metagenome]